MKKALLAIMVTATVVMSLTDNLKCAMIGICTALVSIALMAMIAREEG